MKTSPNKRRQRSCPYKKRELPVEIIPKYEQACNLLHAIELNQGEPLTKKCIAHLAIYVTQAWEDKPCKDKVKKLFCMMNSLLGTTQMDSNEPFKKSLEKYCASSHFLPTLCPSMTLLVAVNYIERLNKKYQGLKGTAGCGTRMIFIAYHLAAKHIYDCLKLIIYTKHVEKPLTPPTSPTIPNNIMQSFEKEDQEKKHKIERMEKEFLCFLNYDLSVVNPEALVRWAQGYNDTKLFVNQEYTSADEGDDEMDDEDDANTHYIHE